MAYIGNNLTVQQYAPQIAYFTGNGTVTSFTLPSPVVSAGQIIVTVNNVVQNPTYAYSVSGSTLTFTSAPPANSTTPQNIWVEYTSLQTNTIAPSPGTISTSSLSSTTGSGAAVLQTSPTISNPTISSPTINGTYTAGTSLITQGTSQATTSGTAITFTGIPSWVKRITVSILGVNTNGSSGVQLQVGTSGGIVSSGYIFYYSQAGSTSGNATSTTGFASFPNSVTNALRSGTFVLTQLTGNTWVCTELIGFIYAGVYYSSQGGGSIALGSALTQVSLASTNGTDTFTAGSVNILYE